MKDPVELILVSSVNNNKYYRLVDTGNGNFNVEYGRVGVTSQTGSYPISQWDTKYREKIKKGYKDVSDLKATITAGNISFNSTDVEHFYGCFSRYTKENVSRNYTIQVGAVTQLMVNEAQGIIDGLSKTDDLDDFNKLLLELYMILPRKMGNVRDHLFKASDLQGKENPFKKKSGQEQDILDSLSSQIITSQVAGDQTIEDLLGVKIEIVTQDPDWVQPLVMSTNSSRYKPYKIYKITHPKRTDEFTKWLDVQSNKNTEFLIHGTRNPNIFSILKGGLIIRPTNAVISGAAYGEGIYHSAHTDKSLGYTGYDNDKIFLIQNVHMGNPFTYEGWYRDGKSISRQQMRYDYLKSIGNDSLYVKPGDGLRNSEYIVFNQEQTNTEYILWMK